MTLTTPNGPVWGTGTSTHADPTVGAWWNADWQGYVRYWNPKKYDYGYGYYGGAYESQLLQWHDPVTRNYDGDGTWTVSFTATDGQSCSYSIRVTF